MKHHLFSSLPPCGHFPLRPYVPHWDGDNNGYFALISRLFFPLPGLKPLPKGSRNPLNRPSPSSRQRYFPLQCPPLFPWILPPQCRCHPRQKSFFSLSCRWRNSLLSIGVFAGQGFSPAIGESIRLFPTFCFNTVYDGQGFFCRETPSFSSDDGETLSSFLKRKTPLSPVDSLPRFPAPPVALFSMNLRPAPPPETNFFLPSRTTNSPPTSGAPFLSCPNGSPLTGSWAVLPPPPPPSGCRSQGS